MTQRLDPQRLRDLRTSAGLSRWDLARAVGLHSRTIADYERGNVRIPTPRTLSRLAEALGVGVPDLLTKEDTSTPGP